jgi:hypothetical protein
MKKKLKNFPFRFKEEKKIYKMKNLLKKNYALVHNSPILTINVSQKERIKILKQKKKTYCTRRL